MTDPAMKRVVSEIVRSPEDKRVYRGLEFTNGLKAVLISDPTTDKSSAGLDVNIGRVFTHSAYLGPRQPPRPILNPETPLVSPSSYFSTGVSTYLLIL